MDPTDLTGVGPLRKAMTLEDVPGFDREHPWESVAEVTWAELTEGPAPLMVDVRSPGEFAEDHPPGAVSVPLLDDWERAVVGSIYRGEGGHAAREWGLGRVSSRLDRFTLALVDALRLREGGAAGIASGVDDHAAPRVVVCARGGQRSGAVTAYLRNRGHAVLRLAGGYRSYREAVRNSLTSCEIPGPIAINGLTGCGKTHVLRAIRKRFPRRVLDLEALAGHRSSVLGDIGLTPATQKRFEAGLAREIAQLEGPWTVFEWEARRVGDREIPGPVYSLLRDAPQLELSATIEQRVRILTDEYLACDGVDEVKRRLPLLASFPAIGCEGVERLIRDLDQGRVSSVVRFLLTKHYDPRYEHGNRGLDRVHQLRLGAYDETAREVIAWIEARC